eukprot:TRINITY_DN2152_c2_g1_i1.p1 TRINITY_DN2152_c2_g1~~TRINITY_DN2152_c2_g1_i1.p1  ORF type:complete len:519 (+),score=71.45 TRINITY_DN2152_c2_g1_i1:138-1694(+)
MEAEAKSSARSPGGPSVPLLWRKDGEESSTTGPKKEPFKDWWVRKRSLALYTVLLLLASVGNSVYFKRMTSAMPNYGLFLTQLSTFIYVPLFAAFAGTGLVKIDIDLVKKFAMMGAFDGISGTLMVLGGVHTSGVLQVLLSQAAIPFTMVLSVLLIGKRYHGFQHLGAATIVLGIVFAKAHKLLDGASQIASQDVPEFNLLFCLALVPGAMSTVFKEIAFRNFDGDLDVNVLQFWVAGFQVVVNFCAMPIYALRLLGPQQVPLDRMLPMAVGGWRCLFLREDQIIDRCGLIDEQPCDTCRDAYLPVCTYLFFNLFLNIFAVLVIKNGSAALSFLVSTLRLPLASIAFSSTLIMGDQATSPGFGDVLSLVVILLGLCSYRYGAKLMKQQLKKEAGEIEADGEASPSPRNSWASPRGAEVESPREREEPRHRWRFVPLFISGSLGNAPQTQFVLVPTEKKQGRSADRVRHDLIRRLGAASPLQSPKFRDRSPWGQSPGQSPQESGGVGHLDFTLTGLPHD